MKKMSTALVFGGVLAFSPINPAFSYGESRFLGIDRDANNRISMEEAHAYRTRLFKEYDLNSDGKVEYEEYVEAEGLRSVTAPPYSKVPVPDEYREMDSNGDTIVTIEEITAAGAARFRSLDKNADGQVSKEEFVSPGL